MRRGCQAGRSTQHWGGAARLAACGEFWKYRVGDYRLICKIEDVSTGGSGPPHRRIAKKSIASVLPETVLVIQPQESVVAKENPGGRETVDCGLRFPLQ